jgi:hypothetical protein
MAASVVNPYFSRNEKIRKAPNLQQQQQQQQYRPAIVRRSLNRAEHIFALIIHLMHYIINQPEG